MLARVLAIVCIFFIGMASDIHAQIYTTLSNNSNLACVNPPSGKNQIAIERDNGFAKTTFKKAKKDTAKKISAERAKIKNANEIIKKLHAGKKRGLSSFNPSSKDFAAVSRFLFGNGQLTDLPPTIDEQIEMVEATKAGFAATILFHQQILGKIKDCEKNKLPAVGELELRYEAVLKGPAKEYTDHLGIVQPVAANAWMLLFAVVPEGAVSPVFKNICKLGPNITGIGGSFPAVISSHKLRDCVGYGFPGTCDHLADEVERSRGAGRFELALIADLNFTWHPDRKTNPCTFQECAAQAEAKLRAVWGDTLPYISGAASPGHCTSLKAGL